MSYGMIDTSILTGIANALRSKLGVQTRYKPTEMAGAITSIPGGGVIPTGTKSITENGTHDVAGYAYAEVSVTGGETDYDNVVLPSEYQRVEYIESAGSPYIELPFGFYPTDEIVTKAALDSSVTDRGKFLVASKEWNTDSNRFGLVGISEYDKRGYLGICYGAEDWKNKTMWPVKSNDGIIHEWRYKDGIAIIKDVKNAIGTYNITYGTESTAIRLFFGYNTNTKGKIAYYIHKKENTSVALYACYRKADDVIGMYDVDNDVFYTNAGSGAFTKGADV